MVEHTRVKFKPPETYDDAYVITENNFLEMLPILCPHILDSEFMVKRKSKRGEVPCYYEVKIISSDNPSDRSCGEPMIFRVGRDVVWIRNAKCKNPNSMFYLSKEDFESQYEIIDK